MILFQILRFETFTTLRAISIYEMKIPFIFTTSSRIRETRFASETHEAARLLLAVGPASSLGKELMEGGGWKQSQKRWKCDETVAPRKFVTIRHFSSQLKRAPIKNIIGRRAFLA